MDQHSQRVRAANRRSASPDGDFILYWMTAFRRPRWNHSLDRAVAWARELGKPLIVLEALRLDYPWASDRFHSFVLQGMQDNASTFKRTNVRYYPYLEPERGAGKGLLAALARRACVVVSDDFPAFFIPRMVQSAARQLPVLLELVDSNGLVPLAAAEKAYPTAYSFRRFAHGGLLDHLEGMPRRRPLAGARLPKVPKLPREITKRWPAADLAAGLGSVPNLPIDHSVGETDCKGGSVAARRTWRSFLENRLPRYGGERNHPEAEATSNLSPYLHFGHISTFEVVDELLDHYGWSPDKVEPAARGKRSGWWGLEEDAESFLDELVTWREVAFNTAVRCPDYESYQSLPGWARETLDAHRSDPREYLYALDQFESGDTHDPLWNAAQRQLLTEGRIHGYLRMLWGKKILEWSQTPEHPHEIMVHLNNKYALDGRDPNSYSGISWVLGKYDRPWAPERPIFGRIRYMTSKSTARKFKVDNYIARHS